MATHHHELPNNGTCQDLTFASLLKTNKVLVVGVSGKIGSGKTCLAEGLQERFKHVLLRNFADRLKDEVAMHLEIDIALCYTHEGKNTYLPQYSMTIGEFLQQWGTKLRDVHEQMWVLALQSFVEAQIREKTSSEPLLVVVGDVRFPNELEWVRRIGGLSVRLTGDPQRERAKSKRNMQHPSETALDQHETEGKFDVLVNTEKNDRIATLQIVSNAIFARF